VGEDGDGDECGFEVVEGVLALLRPNKGYGFPGQARKRGDDAGEVGDETAVEVGESEKRLQGL
jgi:hypothetical protein